jgi:hypothetical protein
VACIKEYGHHRLTLCGDKIAEFNKHFVTKETFKPKLVSLSISQLVG